MYYRKLVENPVTNNYVIEHRTGSIVVQPFFYKELKKLINEVGITYCNNPPAPPLCIIDSSLFDIHILLTVHSISIILSSI